MDISQRATYYANTFIDPANPDEELFDQKYNEYIEKTKWSEEDVENWKNEVRDVKTSEIKSIPDEPERGLMITHENKKKKKIYLLGHDPAILTATSIAMAQIHSNNVVEVINQREKEKDKFNSEVDKLLSMFDNKNPNPSVFTITGNHQVGTCVVLEITYPNCTNHEGRKILLYRNTNCKQIREMKKLDPHFFKDKISPFARFEPTFDGLAAAFKLANILTNA